jgi:hypothetical protein
MFFSNISDITIGDKIPKIVHRLLLYDNDFDYISNSFINDFYQKSKDFQHILWREVDILKIMNQDEIDIYTSYKLKIQKSDYARYIVLKYYGGIYCDCDIKLSKSLSSLYEMCDDDLFFEETTLNKYYREKTKSYLIRNGIPEFSLRIANYIIISKPNSDSINGILQICKERHLLSVNVYYDVIYTTGPDVVSTYFNSHNLKNYLTKGLSNEYLQHICFSHWRTDSHWRTKIYKRFKFNQS